jgi:hypothetical protein
VNKQAASKMNRMSAVLSGRGGESTRLEDLNSLLGKCVEITQISANIAGGGMPLVRRRTGFNVLFGDERQNAWM